jgi:hypothetical protein
MTTMKEYVEAIVAPLEKYRYNLMELEHYYGCSKIGEHSVPWHNVGISYTSDFKLSSIKIYDERGGMIVLYDAACRFALDGIAYEYLRDHVVPDVKRLPVNGRMISYGDGDVQREMRNKIFTCTVANEVKWQDDVPRLGSSIDDAIKLFSRRESPLSHDDSLQLVEWLKRLKKLEEREAERAEDDWHVRRNSHYAPQPRREPETERERLERRWGSHLREAERLDAEDAMRERIRRGDY